MRQTISGLLAAIAVVTVSAAPALACGGGGLFQGGCSPCGESYVSPCAPPAPVYSPCGYGCGGYAHERLPDPVQQYYYADQGPTYSGPGDYAPYPSYREGAVTGWEGYRHHPSYYGYHGGRFANGYPSHPHFRPWRMHRGYGYMHGGGYRYGYAPRHAMRYGAYVAGLHHPMHMHRF